MPVIGDVFNIVLFVSMIGGGLTILSLLANRMLRFSPPLWFSICGMAAYIVPILAPGLYLIPPERQTWRNIYHVFCAVWLCGVILFTLFDIVRTVLAYRAIRTYRVCDNERIAAICTHCCKLTDLKEVPLVYFGTLDGPACVAGVFHPAIILNETIVKTLTDKTLTAVICHEVTHIKRKHIFCGRLYDYICIINWFNPLVWTAKRDFAVHCEVDCDDKALASLGKEISAAEYANAMIRLLELTTLHTDNAGHGLSALGFLLAKQRIELIMGKSTKIRKAIAAFILVLLLAVVSLFSMALSRGHFYPYPAYNTDTEYSHVEK